MGSFDDEVKRALASADTVTRLVGSFVDTSNGRGIVDVGGGRIPADFNGYLPEVNETVWVLFINGTATILGPTVLKPDRGTIQSSPSGNLVAVNIGGVVQNCAYAAGLSLSAGQVVKLGAWNGGAFVYAIMSTQPSTGVAPPAPGGGTGEQQQVFVASDSGSYRAGSGWWQRQVWASDGNQGIWGYGSKLPDTIPAAAVALGLEIYISSVQISGSPPNFALHSYGGTAGAPAPSYAGDTPVAVSDGWVTLPTAWIDSLKAGGGSFGVGVNHGGYSIFNSIVADPMSGALRIRWRT